MVESVPLRPGPLTCTRGPSAPSGQAPNPEFTRNPALLQPHARRAAYSMAPPPGQDWHCTTCTQQGLSTGAFIHQVLLEISIVPHDAQPPSAQGLSHPRSPGVGGGVRLWHLLSRFSFLGQPQMNNPSPLLASSRKGCHPEEAPGSSLQQLRCPQWASLQEQVGWGSQLPFPTGYCPSPAGTSSAL